MKKAKNNSIKVRKGQGKVDLSRDEFDLVAKKIQIGIEEQWRLYDESIKSPQTRKAGAGFEHPEEEVAVEWLEAREAIRQAKVEHDTKGKRPVYVIINGSPRNDNTCPGEMSKSHRLCESAKKILEVGGKVETIDLSRLTAEYGKRIHPCKGCVSTAMPLCHFPCSCYPNAALGQTSDWMNEIYALLTRAHGIMIITPVHWYSPTSVLKLLMDRLVCVDGGNPDITSTRGKTPGLAKKIEVNGWDYPKHLKGRLYSVITHGDSEGVHQVKNSLTSWLNDLGLVSAGSQAELDRYIGYYEPYATSHSALDHDIPLFKEVQNAAQLLKAAVKKALTLPHNVMPTTEDTAIRMK